MQEWCWSCIKNLREMESDITGFWWEWDDGRRQGEQWMCFSGKQMMEGVKESLWNMTWLDNWSLYSVLSDVMHLFKNWREREKKKRERSPSLKKKQTTDLRLKIWYIKTWIDSIMKKTERIRIHIIICRLISPIRCSFEIFIVLILWFPSVQWHPDFFPLEPAFLQYHYHFMLRFLHISHQEL